MARGAARAEACPDIAAIFERVFEVAAFSEEIKYFLKYYLQDCVCDGANVSSARDIYISSSFCVNFGLIGVTCVDDIERYPTTAIRDEVL